MGARVGQEGTCRVTSNAVEALREHARIVLNETFLVNDDFVEAVVAEARKSADPTAAISLIGVLSNLCEDAYCSSWCTSTASAVRRGEPCHVGMYDLTEADIAEAHALASKCGGWWVDVETPPDDLAWLRFVDLRRWCACGDEFASGVYGATETECVNCVVGRGE